MSEVIEVVDNTVVVTEQVTEVVDVGYTQITGESVSGHTPQLYSGAAAPITLRVDGDLYLRDNGDLYQQQAGVWTLQGNIRGPQGATGAQGAAGSDGAPGAQGDPGADGAPGHTPQLYSGAAAPTTLHVDGDLYLRTTGDLYQQQASAWVLQGNIKGPQGATGATGSAGADGADGHTPQLYSGTAAPTTLHVDGDLYLRTTTGDLYQQQSGAWVLAGNLQGPQGATGPAGADGEPGAQGEPGPAGTNGSLVMADSGYITTGNVSVGDSFTQLGPELTIAAAAGDVLEVDPDFLSNNTGSDTVIEAASRVSNADTNYWSSGTSTSRFPGCVGKWYVPTGAFTGSRGAARYTVQAGDVVSGQVTVRLYGRVEAGSRTIFANTTFPLRWTLTNLG